MHVRSYAWLKLLAVAACLIGLLPVAALAQDTAPTGEVVVDKLNGPMGVMFDDSGNLWVVDSGTGGDQTTTATDPSSGQVVTVTYGMTSRIIEVAKSDGTQTEVSTLPSFLIGEEAEGGSRAAQLRGITYVTEPGWHPTMAPQSATEPFTLTGGIARITPSGEAVTEVPMWKYEQSNDVDGQLDNHPYGLTATEDGALLMTDAGGNALYRVNPAAKRAKLIAKFEPFPGVFPNPKYNNENLTDAVPSGVAIKDGEIYVDFVTGAPFIPGASKVVKVADDGTVTDYATGLTMLTDLRTGPDNNLYAVQFAVFNEQGPTPNSGAVIRVPDGSAPEVVIPDLAFPTSIAFDADGNAYVTTNGVGAPGSGQVLKYTNLADVKGTPIEGAAFVGASEAVTSTETVTGTESATTTAAVTATEAVTGTTEATATATAEATAEVTATVAVATAAATTEATAEATATEAATAAAAATTAATSAATTEATAAATTEAAATETPAATETTSEAPKTLPTTGGESTPLLVVIVLSLALVALGGATLATRRRPM